MGHQQFQSRQLPSGHVQHGMGQSQLSQGNQLNRHLSQFSGGANNALFNAAQGTPSTQMDTSGDAFVGLAEFYVDLAISCFIMLKQGLL
uniref:Uncharacterized protein n=1 Tax=Vitis vinifera TaxID=29760 RepID=A5AES6_VITVI|nr:hypothetical protein VITISV_042322 [Vitis vinifera]